MSKSLMNREYTRREFMKMTAKGLAGVSLSGSMLSLLGCTLAQAEQVQLYPNAEFLLVFNPARCTGCQRCEANCTLANDGVAQPYMSRIHVRDYAQFGGKVTVDYLDGEGIFGNWSIPAETCRQCKDAPCMVGCPVKAISPDPRTGARVVDESVCVGCGLCVTNCPWPEAGYGQVNQVHQLRRLRCRLPHQRTENDPMGRRRNCHERRGISKGGVEYERMDRQTLTR